MVRPAIPAPAREIGPVLCVGFQGLRGDRSPGIVPRGFRQAGQSAGGRDMGGQGDLLRRGIA